MSDISTKLTYLDTTKQLLKTEINKINNVLTDNSTFRSYPQELFNGYLDVLNNGTDTLWSNLEKVSQTGTEAVLEKVETAPMKMVLNGNTSQETTTGKNIFNYTRTTKTITTNGVTSTINDDGSITLDGTATALTWFVLNSAFNWESGDYTMYLTDKKIDSFILFSDVGGTDTIKQINVATTITKNISLRIEPNTSFNNLTFFPMILKGKYTLENIGDYEPYTGGQPSPNPDYPQQVKVVKGENVVSVQSKNMANLSILGKVPAVSTGELVNYGGAGCTELIEIDNTKEYVFSFEMITAYDKYVFFYDENKNYITNKRNPESGYKLNDEQVFPRTKYVRIRIDKTPNFKNIQLEQNSQATPYVPYSKTDYPINLNANMFDPTQIPEGNFEKRLSTTGGLYGDIDYFVSDWIPIQPNTEYEVNWTPEAKKRICFYSSFLESSFISSNDTENIFKTPNNATYMRFSNLTSEISNLSVKLKSSLELCKINTYKDYFHKDSGKWYVHKEINKIILDGTNVKFTYQDQSSLPNRLMIPASSRPRGLESSNLVKTTHFKVVERTVPNTTVLGWYYSTQMWIYKEGFTSLTAGNTWLQNNNVTLYYVLATPTETEITNTTLIEQLEAISKAKSVKDKTYITQTNEELPFILDVEAIKEYEVN